MNDRDRLIEIIDNFYENESVVGHVFYFTEEESELFADYLLANGVIVPPCKVGDYVLWDNGLKDSKPKMKEVKGIYYDSTNLGLRYILEDYQPIVNFSSIVGIITKEEAEQALVTDKNVGSKKELG